MKSIYIHIPYCIRKCFYCDFYSLENGGIPDLYLNALLKEIELRSEMTFKDRPTLSTIFLGGGTPSLLRPEQMARIFDSLNKYYDIEDDSEITIESNPGTELEKNLAAYREIGINRLSIGVQSFVDTELKFLKRIHNSKQAVNAVNVAREAGFDNINLDLIFSIPGQTPESLRYSINKALELNIEHIAAYSLIYEKNTPLYKEYKLGTIKQIGEVEDACLYETIVETLDSAGYKQYEVSNFAKTGRKCRHNLNYWRCGEYISFGPSAHSYFNDARFWNSADIDEYINDIKNNTLPVSGSEILSPKSKLFEKIMLGLRSEGIDLIEIQNEFNIDIESKLEELIYNWRSLGYLDKKDYKISLNKRSYFLCDAITSRLLSKIDD